MKSSSVLLLLAAFAGSSSATADTLVTMPNGMTCWMDPNSGFVYGCSGGVQAVNPYSGQPQAESYPNSQGYVIDPYTGQRRRRTLLDDY